MSDKPRVIELGDESLRVELSDGTVLMLVPRDRGVKVVLVTHRRTLSVIPDSSNSIHVIALPREVTGQ